MRYRLALAVGRLIRRLARARGGGSAFPGLVALRIDPLFLEHSIGQLPGGVMFVTGSNGKSTTTSMIAAILREHGKKVFTNPAGSNLPQGLASAVLADADRQGRLPADLAVLEVDEAYGPQIARHIPPAHLVVTNLQLDQLNRFGEPERVWQMMRDVAERTSATLLVNQREPALVALGEGLEVRVDTVDVAQSLVDQSGDSLGAAELFDERSTATASGAPLVTLESRGTRSAIVSDDSSRHEISLPDEGLHWAIDATVALGASRILLGEQWSWDAAVQAFASLPVVYGRGETVQWKGVDITLLMQKNLPSMRANLSTVKTQPERVWVAVDEGTPDPSWIFDLDLGPLKRIDVLSGTKAHQWAMFLAYRGVAVGAVIDDTAQAMDYFSQAGTAPVTAIVNYEQMMAVRRLAGRKDLEARVESGTS